MQAWEVFPLIFAQINPIEGFLKENFLNVIFNWVQMANGTDLAYYFKKETDFGVTHFQIRDEINDHQIVQQTTVQVFQW